MGGGLVDYLLDTIRGQLNLRFGPGDPIAEMVALQKEFQIFSRKHPLRSTAAVLDIGPADRDQRLKWYSYLDHLRTYESDVSGENGHDRIRNAIRRNLGASKPLPIYFTFHDHLEADRVAVTQGVPAAFTRRTYLIVSVPLVPVDDSRLKIAAAVRARRARRKKRRG
jgi:hypothetical protein